MSSSSHHNFQQRGDGGCISIELQAPNHNQVRPNSSNIITYAGTAHNHPNLLHETQKRQNKTKDDQQTAASASILDQKLAANFNFNQVAGKDKSKTTGKPPKAMNQSMQHHGQVIATETDHLDRSLDSISNAGLGQQNLTKHMFNIASSTTLRSCFGTINMDHQQALQPPHLSSKMQILHQEGTVTSTKQTPAQGDANIKGRKMDTPHLVVVKELKEQEDLDELSQIRAKGAHLMPRRSRIQEEIAVNMGFLNNSGLLGQKHGAVDQDNSHAKQREQRAKSQENQYNKGRNKSKERVLATQNQAQNHIKQPVQALKIEDQSKMQSQLKKGTQPLQHIANQRKSHQNHQGGTKSSREGAKTSLSHFNELIVNNNNNKGNGEVANPNNQQQQQSILNNDFKNRTHHEILIQTQPRQFQKAPAHNNEQQQSRSRSRDKKSNQVKGSIQAVLPKSLGSHNRARNFPYPHHEPRKTSTSHAHTDASADKKSSSFIIANEHGRCVTSQGNHQTLSLNSNGRTQSQPSLVKTKGFRQGFHQAVQESDVLGPGAATLLTEQISQNHQISTSPDQHQRQLGNGLSQNQLIDMIVKQNMLKMKQEDKVKRQVSEERIKKRKEQQDTSHIIGRQQQSVNRERMGHKKHQQIVPTLAISTIVNQHQHDNPQQTITNLSSIDYPGANPKLQNFKPAQKWNLKQIKKLNIQKLSQSQRLDFQLLNDQKNAQIKQQAVPSKIQAQLQKHRKSYGLEFIDIKKEIHREEMKTLEQKLYQHKDSVDMNTSQQLHYKHSHNQHFDHDEDEEQQVPRRLNIKQSSKQGGRIQQDTDQLTNSSQYLDTSSNGCQGHQNMRTERGGSDEQQPSVILDHSNNLALNNPPHIEANTSKVLVIKKSKIRKFMKMKKREKQKEMHLQQQSEILKTIKMQENITKLNEFCKKNLQKQLVHKKRNTVTLQQQQPDLKSQMVVNLTKISGRRLNLEQQDHHNQASHNLNGGGQDESSCLSTEFYEEYYQAMNALKSGNQIGQSRQVHHSPTSKSLNHPTRSQNHQNTLIASPKQDDRSANKEDNKSKIVKQHKTIMQHSGNVATLKNQQKFKKAKTTTSKARASGQNHPPQHINLQISDHQQTLINNLISKGRNGGRSGSRERSESAPLYKNHHRKPPTSTVNINQSSSRLNNTTLNDSSINNKKNSLNLSSSQNKDRKIALVVNTDSGSSSKKEGGMSSIEQELLQIYLQNRQQQNLQKSESDPSTVQRINQDYHSRSQQILLTDEEQEEDMDTVRQDDQEAQRQQLQQPPTLDYLITDAEILEDNSCSIPQDTITHIPYLQGEYDDEVYENDEEDEQDYEEDDEEDEEETDNQLIIINQDPFMDDDKKIVYLSNINSCSLPQTPKQDPSSSHSQLNAEIKPINVHPPIQSTFEYIAKKNGLILEQVQYDNQFDEKIESPMIIEEENKHDTERSVIQNPPSFNQKDCNLQMMASEQKIMDYQMRLFTGSESVVREMKLSTPRDLKNVGNVFNELMQTGAKGTSGNKQRTLTAQHSESSLNTIQTHTRQVVQDADLGLQHQTTNTTSSHQSLFDRNSFQHFTAQKLQDMIRNNEFLNLISMRERALDYRKEKEKRYIKKLYKARQMSPRTYTQRKEQLEKWVRLEQNDIHQTKAKYQEEWDKAIQMIEETQKNVVLMREQIFTHQEVHHSAGSHNHRQIKQGEFGGFQSSRNSTASLYATQQSCHKGGERKSILEQEEYQPISHRSNRLLLSAQKPSHLGPVDIPLKTTLHTLGESTMKPDLQTKPSFQVTIDDPKNASKPQNAAAGNLIDFLEESWKKSQISNLPAPTSNLSQLNQIEVEGGNRIFIQDQNNSSSALEGSQKEDSHSSSDLRDKEESSLALKNASDNQSSNEKSIIVDNKVLVESADLNRPLTRSRSQQDLTEQLKKSRLEIDRDNLLAQSENPNDLQEYDSINKDEESFRLMESEHQQNQNSQIVLIRKPQGNDEIKIQENLFEGSSQQQVSLKQYPQHHITSSLNSGLLLLHPEESELPSQDSLLNEHELNHYFNIDAQKKFSIEDFKQLDKRQLLQKNKNEGESEASHFDIYDDDDELQSSRSNKAKNLQGFYRDQFNGVEDGILAEEKQITQESNVSLSQEDHKVQSQRIDDQQMIVSQYLMNNHSEPELMMNQPPSTSSFLFQNAKPGENIKIADILRKNSLGKENNGQQLMNIFSIPEVVSPPQIIHQESFDSSQEREQIAFEIAEDILRMLIDEQVQIPSDFYLKQRPLFNNNESSPEYSLIVPQRIVENDSNGSLPFSTNEDGLQTNPPNQIPMFSNFDALELDDINIETRPQLQLQPQIVPSPQNSQNQDVYVIDTTFNEKEQRRELIDFRQRMLIESDLQRIENYINEIINTLQQHELNYLEGLSGQPHLLNDPNFHRQFLQVLTIPIKRSQLDVLNQLQTSEIGSYEHFETTMDITSHPILPVDLYLDIERQREELSIKMLSNHINGEQDIENSVIQESLHIHNKAIFDALNESLMKFRPYGIQGEPMPWSNKVRRLQTKVDTSQVDTERLFFMVKQDVMRWTSNCVGCLPSQIFIVRRQLPPNPMIQPPTDQFDDEIFQETRERRLASMLTSEVVETEHQWLNYEFEESQVKIDLSDMILEHLVDEVVQCLNNQKFQQQVRQQQNLNFEMVPSSEFEHGFEN